MREQTWRSPSLPAKAYARWGPRMSLSPVKYILFYKRIIYNCSKSRAFSFANSSFVKRPLSYINRNFLTLFSKSSIELHSEDTFWVSEASTVFFCCWTSAVFSISKTISYFFSGRWVCKKLYISAGNSMSMNCFFSFE